jgi:hypothetical protein
VTALSLLRPLVPRGPASNATAAPRRPNADTIAAGPAPTVSRGQFLQTEAVEHGREAVVRKRLELAVVHASLWSQDDVPYSAVVDDRMSAACYWSTMAFPHQHCSAPRIEGKVGRESRDLARTPRRSDHKPVPLLQGRGRSNVSATLRRPLTAAAPVMRCIRTRTETHK